MLLTLSLLLLLLLLLFWSLQVYQFNM